MNDKRINSLHLTEQEANIAFPTDTRLHMDCTEQMWRMGDIGGIGWRRRYTRTVPALLATLRTRSNCLVKERAKAHRRLARCFLKVAKGAAINLTLATAA